MIRSGSGWRLRFGLLSLLVVSISLTAWVGSSAAATTTTFIYTGVEQTYSVPAGAVGVTITAVGAPGGHGGFSSGVAGGYGASVSATVPLQAGTTTLYVEVGGIGASPAGCGSAVFAFNGGGGSYCGGGGGGASDVRLDSATTALTTTDSRLVVAGGGGGGATGDSCGGPAGGAGNTAVTGAGNGGDGNDTNAPPNCTAAAGGNAGLAGTEGGIGGANSPEYNGGRAGSGSLGQGGTTASNQGAGGGGGYWGGGGGGAGFVGGGGGAGSSFWIPGATGTSMSMDTTGTPTVQITPVFAGAAEQLTELLAAVTGVGPGHALADNVKDIQRHVTKNQKKDACHDLGDFIHQVNDMAKGKKPKITAAQAASFIAQAQSIKATLGC